MNEIYEGDEVISVSVQDLPGNAQVVTGFFDKDKSGTVQEDEKIFTIKRNVTGEGTGQYQTQGHGAYGYYHSPMMGIFTGMLMGSMISNAFQPNYVPMYQQPYTTPASPGQRPARLAERLPGGQPGPLQRQDVGVGGEPLVRRQAVPLLRRWVSLGWWSLRLAAPRHAAATDRVGLCPRRMTPIRAIADLPFVRRDVRDLLNLSHHRATPDPDYTGFGHARVDALQLAGDVGGPIRCTARW